MRKLVRVVSSDDGEEEVYIMSLPDEATEEQSMDAAASALAQIMSERGESVSMMFSVEDYEEPDEIESHLAPFYDS